MKNRVLFANIGTETLILEVVRMNKDSRPSVSGRILHCTDIEALLDSYLDEEIDPLTSRQFEQHLDRCELCRSLVDDCRQIVHVAKTLSDKAVPADVSRRLRERLEEEIGYPFAGQTARGLGSDSKINR